MADTPPDALKACPREPTEAMIEAGFDALEQHLRQSGREQFEDAPSWRDQMDKHPEDYGLIRDSLAAVARAMWDATPTIEARAEGGEGEVDYVERLLVLLDALRAADREDVPGLLLAAAEDDAFIAALRPRLADVAGMIEALKATRLELSWCAKQLADRGVRGTKGDSVDRAIAAADAALAQQPASDPDLGKIERGHVCKHGVRWPHPCDDCDEAAWNAREQPASVDLDAEVTQEDRDAAAIALIQLANGYGASGVRAGKCDEFPIVQLFRHHRLRALQHPRPTGEREKAVREAAAVAANFRDNSEACTDPPDAVHKAIVNVSGHIHDAILALIDQPEGGAA